MSKPWEITGDDLEAWARRVDAPALLPKLIRRLLAATTSLDDLEMRADAGTRLGGWDGLVRARDGSRFCPPGVSVWELSVDQKVKTKLGEDFAKRTQIPPPPVRPQLCTYVAVTAHRAPWKIKWSKDRRALESWKDVRLLDADDLAAWIEQAPAVGRWFAAHLGRPSFDIADVEGFLEAWSDRTSPPLPWELVLAGQDREEKAEQLSGWMDRPPSRPLYVRADSREEALLFAVAALAKAPRAEGWLARALVVESEEAWRWATRAERAEPLILLADFEGADPGKAAGRAHAILALDRSVPAVAGQTLDLEPMPYPAMVRKLVEAGRPKPDAQDLIRRAGGSLATMQRLLGYVELPAWAKGAPRPELFALLLAGAWVPSNTADREVIAKLGGDPAVLEQLCNELERRGEISRVREYARHDALRWRSPEGAWLMLSAGLTEGHLGRFQEVVLDVLGAPDPAEARFPAEQIEALMQGRSLACSGALRVGLAESIARLAVSDEQLKAVYGNSRGSQTAEGILWRLLNPEKGWQAWASLSSLLRRLAEAAPDDFLDLLDKSLDQQDKGVSHLFVLEQKGGFGRAPHTGLIWALEMLGWSPDLGIVRRVALALARLAARDPGGRLSNRPSERLHDLLHVAIPQSQTSVTERLAIFDNIFALALERDIGWKLGVDWIMSLAGTMMTPSQKPQIRKWKIAEPKGTHDDLNKQISGVLDRLIRRADGDAEKWAELISAATHLYGVEEQVFDALEARRDQIADTEGKIWAALRHELHWELRIDDKDEKTERRDRLAKLYKEWTPTDLLKRVEWLFLPQAEPPEIGADDFEKKEQWLALCQQKALADLWQQGDARWQLLAELTERVKEAPGSLGATLATAPFAEELESRLLLGPGEKVYAPIVPSFGARRGVDRLPWLEGILRGLLERGRADDAVEIALTSPQTASLWDALDRIGDPLRGEYWRRLQRVLGARPVEERERAINELLAAGNETIALQAASWSKANISSELALRVLEQVAERLRRAKPGDELDRVIRTIRGHDVVRVFEIVDCEPTLDPQRVFQAELGLLSFLKDSKRSAKHLSRALTDQPDNFLQIISMMTLREGEGEVHNEDNQASAERQQAVARAYRVLDAWKSYPGNELPGAEREAKLEAWATYVLDKARADGRGRTASVHVAEVLARAPNGDDGLWPCVAARKLLEKGSYENLSDHLRMAKYNLRGATRRALTDGGAQERKLAEDFRSAARQLQDGYPRTAVMLDALAREYEDEAEMLDPEAKRHRIEWGEETEPPAPRAPAEEELPDDEDELWPPKRPLLAVRARNFLSFRNVRVDLGALNVLVGPNGSGKTNFLHLIRFLGDAARDDLDPALARLGGLERVRFRGAAYGKGKVEIAVEANTTRYASASSPDSYLLRFGDETGALERYEQIRFKTSPGGERTLVTQGNKLRARNEAGKRVKGASLKPRSLALSTLPRLSGIRGIRQVRAIGHLFSTCRFFEVDVSKARAPAEPSEKTSLLPDASNLAAFLRWLSEHHPPQLAALEEDARAMIPGFERLRFRTLGGAKEAVAVDFDEIGLMDATKLGEASFGSIRALALLALLYDPNPPALTCVEEIDSGLHPHVLDRLVDRLREASTRTQLIVTTHSPALVNRLAASELIVCERDRDSGETRMPAVEPEIVRAMEKKLEGKMGLGELWFTGTLGGVP